MKIGEVIRRERRRKGWTQGQLGLYSDLSPEHIGMIERGLRKEPAARTLAKIASALGVSCDYLATEAGMMDRDNEIPPGLPPEVERVARAIAAYPDGPAKEEAKRITASIGNMLEDILGQLIESEGVINAVDRTGIPRGPTEDR